MTHELINTILASIGTALGLVALCITLFQIRLQHGVRLKVSAGQSFAVIGSQLGPTMFSISVVNLSSFPVTVSMVGLLEAGRKGRKAVSMDGPLQASQLVAGYAALPSMKPVLPYRLASHESVDFYFPMEWVKEAMKSEIRFAFIQTQCGIVAKGGVSTLKAIRRSLASEEAE